MSFQKGDFFVQFRVFYNKEFTRQKKVTNKLFISVRCVVIAKRGGGVRRRDGIRMVACQCGGMYRRLLFLFYLNTED